MAGVLLTGVAVTAAATGAATAVTPSAVAGAGGGSSAWPSRPSGLTRARRTTEGVSAMPEDEPMDARAAAALMQEKRSRARDALQVRLPLMYAGWGVAWLAGIGVMWLSVRTQRPYRGPSSAAVGVLSALIVAAIAISIVTSARSARGVHGPSVLQRRIYGLSWPIGFAALFGIVGALGDHGASAAVMGIIGATGPVLVTSLIYLVGAATWLDRSMLALGAWLALVAAAGAATGPVTVLLIEALAGGGGFLLAAAVVARRPRP